MKKVIWNGKNAIMIKRRIYAPGDSISKDLVPDDFIADCIIPAKKKSKDDSNDKKD